MTTCGWVSRCQPVLPFLECELRLDGAGARELGLKSPMFVAQSGAGNTSSVQRLLDVYCPNACSAPQSYVPNMMSKASWYAIPASQYLGRRRA